MTVSQKKFKHHAFRSLYVMLYDTKEAVKCLQWRHDSYTSQKLYRICVSYILLYFTWNYPLPPGENPIAVNKYYYYYYYYYYLRCWQPFTLPLILLNTDLFIYFIRASSACYEKFPLTFISTDFTKGIILYLRQFQSERTVAFYSYFLHYFENAILVNTAWAIRYSVRKACFWEIVEKYMAAIVNGM
jgi:hypothetical protein